MRRRGLAGLAAAACLGLGACAPATITPEMVRAVERHLTVVVPEGDGKFPVVFFYQGTGGGNRRAEIWARWLREIGVAAAIVDNAGLRGRRMNPSGSMYTEDAAIAWDLLKTHGKLDTTRFALMGFSRGGQQALLAGPDFAGARAAPALVFAMYPGGFGPNLCVSTHRAPTRVHIFYGDLDGVGSGDGTSSACRALAGGRNPVEFHDLPGATHGYDDVQSYSFACCRGVTVRVEPNPAAVERTRAIIERALRAAWGP